MILLRYCFSDSVTVCVELGLGLGSCRTCYQ